MKNECNIIRDILPLYAEKMVSDDTVAFVQEHLKGCPACRAELEKMREPVQPAPDIDTAPLKRLKKALMVEKVQTVLCTVVLLLALVLSGLAFLTAPEYFDYSPELVTVTEGENGAATISFNNKVTNYTIQKITDPSDQQTIYHVETWTSAWDKIFKKPGAQDIVIEAENGNPLIIFFTQYNRQSTDAEPVCIYGALDTNSGGWIALPGLSLGYWLIINVALFITFGMIWLLLRKKDRPRKWIERLLFIPVAYGLGHICVLGFRTISYSEWRDFQLILAIGILFYCAMFLALSIYYSRKEIRQMQKELSNE